MFLEMKSRETSRFKGNRNSLYPNGHAVVGKCQLYLTILVVVVVFGGWWGIGTVDILVC